MIHDPSRIVYCCWMLEEDEKLQVVAHNCM